MRLKPIIYLWKETGNADFGLGAEDVAKVVPELAFTNKQGVVEGVKYEKLSLLLINSVKEQQTQIKALQQQVKAQQSEIDAFKALACKHNRRTNVCRSKK